MRFTFTKPADPDWTPPLLTWHDGYPTRKTLMAIRNWPYDKAEELFLGLQTNWFGGGDYCWKDEAAAGCWHISSAGWSGNESCLSEMQRNHLLWLMIFVGHKDGGHYIFNSEFPYRKFRVSFTVEVKEEWRG